MRIQEDINAETLESDEVPELVPVLNVGKNYNKVVSKAGKGKNKERGPVHIWTWSALIRQVALSSQLPGPEKQVLQTYVESHSTIPVLKREVPLCIVHREYGRPKVLISVHIRSQSQPAWEIIKSFFVKVSQTEIIPGLAPRGPIFRDLVDDLCM